MLLVIATSHRLMVFPAMASLSWHKTGRSGVFDIEGQTKQQSSVPDSSSNTLDKNYYIMYYFDGKIIDEKDGREWELRNHSKIALRNDHWRLMQYPG